MNLTRCLRDWVIGGILVIASAHPLAAGVLHYDIKPGGQYTYLPSPESTGIPGCIPSNFECDFEIDGSFSVMVDADMRIATLFAVDLILIGNEEVQQIELTPLVSAEGVGGWLEDRSFERDLNSLGPFEIFASTTYPNLQLTDLLNGTVTLSGGYDYTPSDGDGAQFALTAEVVPEPSSFVLLALGLAVALTWRRAVDRLI